MPRALALPLGTPWVNAAPPAKGTILAGVEATMWGESAITAILFPDEDWRFHLVVV